ncbi:MAG: transposase, partial [Bdellovibrionales bacterium]|nr:transposase [Bdellovibrionales bacterium]
REKVCYEFFKDLFEKQVSDFNESRASWRGLKIYAIDGFEVILPRTDDILNEGYNGRQKSKYSKTYYPRMYIVHAYDVLSRVSKEIYQSDVNDELTGADHLVSEFEDKSLTLYDRFYFCRRTVKRHRNNYFLARLKSGSNLKAVQGFIDSKDKRRTVKICGQEVHLFRIKNPKTQKKDYFATTLPLEWMNNTVIRQLYNQRWDVETSFKDMTESLKVEQWHSKTLNGCLQELYARMWLMNYTRIQIFFKSKFKKNSITRRYKAANFKLVLGWVERNFAKIFQRVKGVLKPLEEIIKRTLECRKRHSRSYPRHIKKPQSPYPYVNTVEDL